MTPRPPLRIPRPEDLAIPLRDLFRGVQQAARIPMALAQPVVSHLPDPVRDTLSQIGQRAEVIYKDSLTIWRPSAPEIRRATTLLTDANPSDLAATGRVVAWALEVALARQDNTPQFFISETVVTLALDEALSKTATDADPSARAAAVLFAVVSHGLGPSPDTFPSPRMTPERIAQLRSAAFAAALFLLAERSVDLDDEIRILSYAITITDLIAAEIHAAAEPVDNATHIAALLRQHAEMI